MAVTSSTSAELIAVSCKIIPVLLSPSHNSADSHSSPDLRRLQNLHRTRSYSCKARSSLSLRHCPLRRCAGRFLLRIERRWS